MRCPSVGVWTSLTARKNPNFIHADHLNTPRLITNQAQQAVWRRDNQEPFGDSPADENPSGLGVFEFDLGFMGQRRDRETGLWYNGQRDGYNPAIGGYTQPEPLGLYGDINLYRYARSSPLMYVDPDGRQATSVIGGALGGGARGSVLGLPGFIGGVAIGALVPWMCQVTDRERCERGCDRDYDWDQKQCEWFWKMHGRDPNVLRVCMDRARQDYLDCYRDCAK